MPKVHSLFLEKTKIDFLQTVDCLSEGEWRNFLEDSYHQFEVLDAHGRWTFKELGKHQLFLIPPKNIKPKLREFLEEVYIGCLENDYLMDFLTQINPADNYQFNKAHLLSFAFTLDRFNRVLRDDIDLLELTVAHYQKLRLKKNFYRLSNILAIIKLHSIQKPAVKFIKARKKGFLSKSFGKIFLTFNIFEAFLVDLCTGFKKNALSTLPLMFFNPNYQGWWGLSKSYLKGSPSRFSADGKALEMHSPRQKEWSDLYQVWNMALVAQFDQAPYLLTKLLIPSVSRYSDRPGEYMHTRITALLLAMNFIDYATHFPKTPILIHHVGPLSKDLIHQWGDVNLKAAEKYKELVRLPKKSLLFYRHQE